MEFKTLKLISKFVISLHLVFIFVTFNSQAKVMLMDGFVRALPASVPNSAAYVTLHNKGEYTELIAVKTDIAKEAQLHTLIEEDGLVKMRQVANFALPANGMLTLAPSGDHIMLMGLNKSLVLNKKVNLTLIFENGESLPISLPVLAPKMHHMESEHHLH